MKFQIDSLNNKVIFDHTHVEQTNKIIWRYKDEMQWNSRTTHLLRQRYCHSLFYSGKINWGQTEKYLILEEEQKEACDLRRLRFENLMAVDEELEKLCTDCNKHFYAIMKPQIIEII